MRQGPDPSERFGSGTRRSANGDTDAAEAAPSNNGSSAGYTDTDRHNRFALCPADVSTVDAAAHLDAYCRAVTDAHRATRTNRNSNRKTVAHADGARFIFSDAQSDREGVYHRSGVACRENRDFDSSTGSADGNDRGRPCRCRGADLVHTELQPDGSSRSNSGSLRPWNLRADRSSDVANIAV